MASPEGWRRNKAIERKNRTGNLEYYWNDPEDVAGTYISITDLPGKEGYSISGMMYGGTISRQNFDNPYSNKEEARKDAVAWMKRNKP